MSAIIMWKKIGNIMGSFSQEKERDYEMEQKMGFIIHYQPKFTHHDYSHQAREGKEEEKEEGGEGEEEEE